MPWLAMMTMMAAIHAAEADGCVIEVVGLPVPARAHHRLEVDGGRAQLNGDGLRLQIRLEYVIVRLIGPRYFGELRLKQAQCTGDTIHSLQAHPRAAVLIFESAPPELVLKVLDGPDSIAKMRDQWIVARSFPPLPVGHGAQIELELLAPHFHTARKKLNLLPGDNEIEVALVPS
ncbi:MAG TPA: hypothetical protein VG755_33750 [Nannocystaceae bacterium]|nr:hypothetical protein [Nannocystaceae bacterium]